MESGAAEASAPGRTYHAYRKDRRTGCSHGNVAGPGLVVHHGRLRGGQKEPQRQRISRPATVDALGLCRRKMARQVNVGMQSTR